MLTTLYELRNPHKIDGFDFTDSNTGEVREYFDNGLTNSQKLDQIESIIVRLKDYKKRPVVVDNANKDDVDGDLQAAYNEAKHDGSVEIDNSKAAEDEFLIWEPRNCLERIWNIFQNMMESYMFLIVGMAAFIHPSLNSMIFMLLTLLLFHSMTKHVKDRFKWNMLFLMIITVYLVVVISTKLIKQLKYFKEGATFEKEEYAKTIHTLLMMGFSFKYDTDIFDLSKRDTLQCPCELTQFSFINSYDIEFIVAITSLLLFFYSLRKHYQIKS